MFKITNILNPLTGGATTEEYKWESGKPLSEYMDYSGECIVACNNEVIELPLDAIFPMDMDEYRVMPIPEGGDSGTLRMIGRAAMDMVDFIPGWGRILALMGSALITQFLKDKKETQDTSQSYAWQHASSPMASHGIAMPVIYGKARIRPILKNRYITVEGDKQWLYALYGLAAHKVDVRTGLPTSGDFWRLNNGDEFTWDVMPGTTLIYRSVIPEGGYPMGHGLGAFFNDIIINGRSINDYHDDVDWETRPGLPEQDVIQGFDVTYSNFIQDEILYLDYPEIVKKTADFQLDRSTMTVVWKEHSLLFHGEYYKINAGDHTLIGMAGKRVYFYWDPTIDKNSYQNTYTDDPDAPPALLDTSFIIYSFIVLAVSWTKGEWPYTTNLPVGDDWYQPVLTLISLHNIELMFEFPYGILGDKVGGGITSGTCRLFAQYREYGTDKWLNFSSGFSKPDHKIDYDDTDTGAIVVTRKTQKTFNISLKAVTKTEALIYGKTYEIRMTASSPSIVKLVNVATIVYGAENTGKEDSPGFTYPGEPLLGIKALASGQISGDLDVQVDVERSEVWVYNTRYTTDRDGNASSGRWVKGPAHNHAWAVYDILAQGHPDHPAYPLADNEDAESIYGCGIDKDHIDYESFRTWADYVGGYDEGELGYELNIVFDTFMNAWDAILRICQEGRGMVYPIGTKIYAFTDKAEDVSQVFTMGNIHQDTFVQKFVESGQKVNMVEANYYDAERNYEKTMIAARTADWDSSTGLSIPVKLTLYGTTSFDQAWSIIRFILMGNELLNNVISFGVDVDALAVQAGDVVEVQHDILISDGGRVVGYEENLCQNPSFETGGWSPWTIWGSPFTRQIVTTTVFSGTYSWEHLSLTTNSGNQQTFDVSPSTVYTLSCWVYIISDTGGPDTIRITTTVDGGGTFPRDDADVGVIGSWQRLSFTVTTGVAQATMTVWAGGIGNCYFDAIQVEQASAVTEWMNQSRVTLDKTFTLASSGVYELIVWRAGTRVSKTTSLNLGGTANTLEFSTAWSTPPEQYDSYAFGISGSVVKKYRITNISRTNELMRTLTLVQYDARLYDSYKPSDDVPSSEAGEFTLNKVAVPDATIETVANLLNLASNLKLREVLSRNRVTGEYESSIVATWTETPGAPRGSWEVWFRDVDVSDVDWEGEWESGSYDRDAKVEHGGKTFISLEDENITEPFNT